MNFDGIWCPAVTPFNEDDSINYGRLSELIESLIAAGVHGLIIGGTTGEYYALEIDDRIKMFQHVAEQFKGRIPLVAGINSTNTEDSLVLGLAAKRCGFDAVLVAAPYYCQPTQEELIHHVVVLDEAIDLPVMLYNFPDRTGTPMDRDFLDAVASRPNIQSIKESTGSMERLHTLMTEYSDELQVCCGMDDQILEFFTWGAPGWVCGAANFLPREHVAIYEACVKEKDLEKGRALVRQMLPLLNLLEQGGKFCQCIKYGCELAGFDVGQTKAPLLPLTGDEQSDMKAIYEQLVASR